MTYNLIHRCYLVQSVRAVMLPDGQPVKRYALTVEEAFAPETIYLVNTVLNEVVREGTGAALRGLLPADLVVAGKTGTTDDYRDSWFAGFAENLLGVVWVGNDDNRSIGLTGRLICRCRPMSNWSGLTRTVGCGQRAVANILSNCPL